MKKNCSQNLKVRLINNVRVFVFTSKPPICDGGAKKISMSIIPLTFAYRIEMKLFTCVSANRKPEKLKCDTNFIFYIEMCRVEISTFKTNAIHITCARHSFVFVIFHDNFWRMYKYILLEIHEIIICFFFLLEMN